MIIPHFALFNGVISCYRCFSMLQPTGRRQRTVRLCNPGLPPAPASAPISPPGVSLVRDSSHSSSSVPAPHGICESSTSPACHPARRHLNLACLAERRRIPNVVDGLLTPDRLAFPETAQPVTQHMSIRTRPVACKACRVVTPEIGTARHLRDAVINFRHCQMSRARRSSSSHGSCDVDRPAVGEPPRSERSCCTTECQKHPCHSHGVIGLAGCSITSVWWNMIGSRSAGQKS